MKYHIFVYTGHIPPAISDLRVLTVLDLSLRSTETQPTCKDCRGGRRCGAPLSKPDSPLSAHQKNSNNNNNNWLFFSYNILEALRKKYEIFLELRSRESNCLPSMWNGIIPSTCRLKVILSEGSNSEYTSSVATAVLNERKKNEHFDKQSIWYLLTLRTFRNIQLYSPFYSPEVSEGVLAICFSWYIFAISHWRWFCQIN